MCVFCCFNRQGLNLATPFKTGFLVFLLQVIIPIQKATGNQNGLEINNLCQKNTTPKSRPSTREPEANSINKPHCWNALGVDFNCTEVRKFQSGSSIKAVPWTLYLKDMHIKTHSAQMKSRKATVTGAQVWSNKINLRSEEPWQEARCLERESQPPHHHLLAVWPWVDHLSFLSYSIWYTASFSWCY